jgi:glycoprotein-N-acetylgalactosamine 3-beta-galactosyltransferase
MDGALNETPSSFQCRGEYRTYIIVLASIYLLSFLNLSTRFSDYEYYNNAEGGAPHRHSDETAPYHYSAGGRRRSHSQIRPARKNETDTTLILSRSTTERITIRQIQEEEEAKQTNIVSSSSPHHQSSPAHSVNTKSATTYDDGNSISKEKNATSDIQDSFDKMQHPQHPHAGARYANGSWGYVADVTLVRRWMLQGYHQNSSSSSSYNNNARSDPPLSYLPLQAGSQMKVVCNTKKGEGTEKRAGWRLLTTKVLVDAPNPLPLVNTSSSSTPTQQVDGKPSKIITSSSNSNNHSGDDNHHSHSKKLLCAIYTYGENREKVKAIAETWGWRCDGFFAASTETVDDPLEIGLGQIDLPHEGPEEYENLWMKVRSIFAYMYDHYLDDYDFFFLSGDDAHVIVENLRRVLESSIIMDDETTTTKNENDFPLYLGHWIPFLNKKDYFCGGGAGYVLNRVALRILVRDLFPNCFPHIRGADDVVLADCFRRVGIVGNNSVDATGAQRFHGMTPSEVATFKAKNGFYKEVYEFWGKHFGYKKGLDLVSSQSVSFHGLKGPTSMRRHHAILYKSCPKGTVLGDTLAKS